MKLGWGYSVFILQLQCYLNCLNIDEAGGLLYSFTHFSLAGLRVTQFHLSSLFQGPIQCLYTFKGGGYSLVSVPPQLIENVTWDYNTLFKLTKLWLQLFCHCKAIIMGIALATWTLKCS